MTARQTGTGAEGRPAVLTADLLIDLVHSLGPRPRFIEWPISLAAARHARRCLRHHFYSKGMRRHIRAEKAVSA